MKVGLIARLVLSCWEGCGLDVVGLHWTTSNNWHHFLRSWLSWWQNLEKYFENNCHYPFRVLVKLEKDGDLCQNLKPNRTSVAFLHAPNPSSDTSGLVSLNQRSKQTTDAQRVSGDPCRRWTSFKTKHGLYTVCGGHMAPVAPRLFPHGSEEGRNNLPAQFVRWPCLWFIGAFRKVKKLWLTYYLSSILIT